MTPRDHVARAQALLNAATDPHDQAAYRGVIAAWTRLAAPALPWSHDPARRALAQLQRDVAAPLEAAAPELTDTGGKRQIAPTEGNPHRTLIATATITF